VEKWVRIFFYRQSDETKPQRFVCHVCLKYNSDIEKTRYNTVVASHGFNVNKPGPYTHGFPCYDGHDEDQFKKRNSYRNGVFKIVRYEQQQVVLPK